MFWVQSLRPRSEGTSAYCLTLEMHLRSLVPLLALILVATSFSLPSELSAPNTAKGEFGRRCRPVSLLT
jgi:hypothetical protein